MRAADTRPFLNGMCYVYEFTKGMVPPERAAALMRALNVKSVRSWSHITWLLKDPDTADKEHCGEFHRVYALLRECGVEQLVGMSHTWFYPKDCPNVPGDAFSVPRRDMAEGSVYRRFLDMYERAWQTLAAEFPEITYWETGNEQNHDPFLHPLDYTADPEKNKFTLREKAEISCDMMLYAARGIKRANPSAHIIQPGMAPIGEHGLGVVADNVRVDYAGMEQTMKAIYEIIESGQCGSSDPRDYFDSLCWHPYYARQMADGSWKWQVPDDAWVEMNNAIYQVAVDHGDDGIDCYFSEFGYNDFGDGATDHELVEHVLTGTEIIREKMPYVASVHAYRMFEMLDVADTLDTYAFFHVDQDGSIHPKERVYALQRAYGGTLPL